VPRLREIAILRVLSANAAAFFPKTTVSPAAFAKNRALVQSVCKRGRQNPNREKNHIVFKRFPKKTIFVLVKYRSL